MNIVTIAQEFAHHAHDSIGQKRKYSGEPYWVHTDQVAQIVSSVIPENTDAICAAHLHDVLEDVAPLDKEGKFQAFNILNLFGKNILTLVQELTDVYSKEAYPHLNRAARKSLELKRLESISSVTKTIKLADLISNTQSIIKEDKDFAPTYITEKLNLLPLLSDGHPQLLQQATIQTIMACQELGIKIPIVSI